MSTYDLVPTPEQLQAIGKVAAEYSYLESIVETAIWRLLEIDEDDGRAITTNVRMRDRLDILRTLFRLRRTDAGGAETLDKLYKEICGEGGVASQRAKLVHALWVRGELSNDACREGERHFGKDEARHKCQRYRSRSGPHP